MLALGLQSCQENDGPDTKQYPILFGYYQSRAAADITDLREDGFKVYAYFKGNAGSATFEKDVEYRQNDEVWAYTNLEYWVPGVNYWFTAFYPKAPTSATVTIDNSNSTQAFEIEDLNISAQEDIMVAKEYCEVGTGALFPQAGNVVSFKFEHLLACVVIEMKSAIDNVTINNVTINNIADHGTYSNGAWSSSNRGSAKIESDVTLSKGADHADVTKGGILVIPEATGTQELEIEASNGKTYRANFPAGTWSKGNKYTYTVEIKQNDIIFKDLTADNVQDWDSESATGSVIIK